MGQNTMAFFERNIQEFILCRVGNWDGGFYNYQFHHEEKVSFMILQELCFESRLYSANVIAAELQHQNGYDVLYLLCYNNSQNLGKMKLMKLAE